MTDEVLVVVKEVDPRTSEDGYRSYSKSYKIVPELFVHFNLKLGVFLLSRSFDVNKPNFVGFQ